MSEQYDEYLKGHIEAVGKAARWMVGNLPMHAWVSEREVREFLRGAAEHDGSKWDDAEYQPYDDWFYGEKDEDAFDRAWLHHIHHNPHHWQHWLLVNDDGEAGEAGKLVALEMPRACALEMVADWWSFSWRSGNLTEVFDWYEDHKDQIILHESTRSFVEEVLREIHKRI